MKIVETDNFDSDYPNEKVVNLPSLTKEHAEAIAKAINDGFPMDHPRYWAVVSDDYTPRPGFEP